MSIFALKSLSQWRHTEPQVAPLEPKETKPKRKSFKADRSEKIELVGSSVREYSSAEVIKLSSLDVTRPFTWDTSVYAFENNRMSETFMDRDQLKESLGRALRELPILCGELQNCDGTLLTPLAVSGDMQVKLSGRGAWFCAHNVLEDFGEMQVSFNTHVLPGVLSFQRMISVMHTPFLPKDQQAPLLAIKANYFPCGSVVIVVMMNQLVADARSRIEFMKLWGTLFRLEDPIKFPRDGRRSLAPKDTANDHVRSLAREWGGYRCPRTLPPMQLRSCLITIPASALNKHMCRVNSQSMMDEQWARPDDFFNAIVWRAVTRARDVPPEETSSLQRTTNIRSAIGMDDETFCNATLSNTILPLTVGQLLSIPPEMVAMQLWRKESRISDSSVRDFISAVALVKPKGRPLWKMSSTQQLDMFSNSYSHLDWENVRFQTPVVNWFHVSQPRDGWFIIYPKIRSLRIAQICIEADILSRLAADTELKEWGFKVIPTEFSTINHMM